MAMQMIGEKLGGRYEIIARAGGGGMAVVYKARDALLHRYVAIKVLNEALRNDSEFVRRFSREAQAAASLSHPNIVNVYDVGYDGYTHYIVMELVEGPTLKQYVRACAPLSLQEATAIAVQICEGLAHAHENQIVHRDIKPHNILLGSRGSVKVTDFGIARATTSSTITQTGSVMGSVHYFSPEQARGGLIDQKSDLYSLGIVLYEMLTGRLPFGGDSAVGIALQHLQDPLPDPKAFNEEIPPELIAVLQRALEKEPTDRFPSALVMKEALLRAVPIDQHQRLAWQNYQVGTGAEEAESPAPAAAPVATTPLRSAAPAKKLAAHEEATILQKTTAWLERAPARRMPLLQRALFGVFTVLFVLVLSAFGLFQLLGWLQDGSTSKDPVVQNATKPGDTTSPTFASLEEAQGFARRNGLPAPVVESIYRADMAPGTILKQEPAAGETVSSTQPIRLSIASRTAGPSSTTPISAASLEADGTVKNYVGLFESKLEQQGLKDGVDVTKVHCRAPRSTTRAIIIDQSPAAGVKPTATDHLKVWINIPNMKDCTDLPSSST